MWLKDDIVMWRKRRKKRVVKDVEMFQRCGGGGVQRGGSGVVWVVFCRRRASVSSLTCVTVKVTLKVQFRSIIFIWFTIRVARLRAKANCLVASTVLEEHHSVEVMRRCTYAPRKMLAPGHAVVDKGIKVGLTCIDHEGRTRCAITTNRVENSLSLHDGRCAS